MSIMQQSSKAQDRALGVWFQNIQQGQIKLPRFQRYEAWDRGRITSFLNTIINNLPVGVTLALEVAGEEKFISRYIVSAEPALQGGVTQHLLDGQQRLTAFWRAMHNNYDSEDYFIYLPQFDQRESKQSEEIEVNCQSRWTSKKGSRRPVWTDDPSKCLGRGLFPIDLLCPGDNSAAVDAWIGKATQELEPDENDSEALKKYKVYTATKEKLKEDISTLRERVTHFNLPYLSLPSNTPKDVALQVFINMNTSSKPLSLYDIIVAEVESVAGKSLHDLEEHLVSKCPKAARFGDVRNLILATSALLQEKIPNNKGMVEMDKQVLLDNWEKLELGLERMANLLESQAIFDEARLPTSNVLAVVAAAYDLVPEHGDFVAKAEKLLRAYLWSSFFTDRYENSAASRAYADFIGVKDKHRGIKAFLNKQGFDENTLSEVPVFNRKEHELADVDALMAAGWPKKVGIEARGILAVSNYFGGQDFADGRHASFESIQKREYHHIFPDALLSAAGIDSYRALNCALITWKTNRIIGRKDPLDYLKERVQWADEKAVSNRLKTHLVSFELLSKAHYKGLEGEALKSKLVVDFDSFMRNRAQLVHQAVIHLAAGEQPSLDSIWAALLSTDGTHDR
ncbi:GmrSD restriction endonuclease domain-containing protein [Granulosicoccus sp. 3-233]|uniref:GmrSD restriction endonuclease domain-containing protein n=1 Tax=Granulosicoccus sp. 3-233 TaxID=3417969 RepID=UPI003D352F21